MSRRLEPDLLALRRHAEELAQGRRERASTAHLLAAVASSPGPAADLLVHRGLGGERLLRAARSATDDAERAVDDALRAAQDVAERSLLPAASPAHVVAAVLSERQTAGYRVVDQCGVDVARLRAAMLQLGLDPGARRRASEAVEERVGARRPAPSLAGEAQRAPAGEPQRAPAGEAQRAPAREPQRAPARDGLGPGQTVPLFPPPGKSLIVPRRPRGAADAGAPAAPPPAPPAPAPARPSRPPEAPPRGAAPPVAPVAEAAPLFALAPAPPPTGAAPPRARGRRRAGADASRFALDPQRNPALTELGRNLTLAAARGELDPAVGREREIEQALDVLAKRQGNNPCLVGPAGVGKTSVVRGLAQRIAEGREVASLDDRVVVEIAVGELLAGTAVRGSLAQRMAQLRKEVGAAAGRVVLFFDEIHQLFQGEGVEELGGELKLALARGELPCIGATTPEEWRKSIEADPALARRFSLVEVEEPSREDAYLVLSSQAERLTQHHGVRYREDALALAVNWSVRFLPGRHLPDKAVSIVDLAGARARRRGHAEVDPEAVAEVVAELADLPVERLLETDGDRMLRLEAILAERVVGHAEPIARMARILRRNAAGLGSRRPIGTFLLLGPTGVGKTETAKAIAEVLFHDERALTRLDLSEYGEAHAVARLIGAPPGYVGHEAGGQLTEAVRRRPYQVVLLDEIEKAHPDVLITFLAMFDEGRLTDGRGRLVDFTNTVIILTSNLGSAEAATAQRRRVGFGASSATQGSVEQAVVGAARSALPPELYNRLDEVMVFAALGRDEVAEVARRLLAETALRLAAQRDVRLEYDGAVVEALLDLGGYDPSLGARPMRRAIARLVEAPLAELILSGRLGRGDTARLVRFGDALRVDAVRAAEGARAPGAARRA